MFRDRSEELRRLEEALLEDEPTEMPEKTDDTPAEDEDLLEEQMLDELLEDTAPAKGAVPYHNYSNDYGQGYTAYNTDVTDEDLDEYCQQVREAPKKDNTGLVILACLLALGVLGMVIYLMLRSGGIL